MDEDLKAAAARSVEDGGDIRARVRDLTLGALRDRHLDFPAVQSVMREIGAGVTLGAQGHGARVREALGEAFKGMDEAIGKAAHGGRLALEEMVARGREGPGAEWKATLESMQRLEGEFIANLSRLAQGSTGAVKQELEALMQHAARSGTDTGAAVAQVTSELTQRMAAISSDATHAGAAAARAMADHLAQITSGFLDGVSAAIQQGSRDPKQ